MTKEELIEQLKLFVNNNYIPIKNRNRIYIFYSNPSNLHLIIYTTAKIFDIYTHNNSLHMLNRVLYKSKTHSHRQIGRKLKLSDKALEKLLIKVLNAALRNKLENC